MLHLHARQATADMIPFQPRAVRCQDREEGYALVFGPLHPMEACYSLTSWGRPFMSAAFKTHGGGFAVKRGKVH